MKSFEEFFKLSKCYVKKFCVKDGFDVWIVDGKYIRNSIDEQFTNFGQHYRFGYIPKNEIWVDHESKDEIELHMDVAIEEFHHMNNDEEYGKSHDESEKTEIAIRKEKDKKDVHIKLLDNDGEVKIWLVDGNAVRNQFSVDFTEGGHDKVYDYVPENEIWIDDAVVESERKYVIHHESVERKLMCKNYTYDQAHLIASEEEMELRQEDGLVK